MQNWSEYIQQLSSQIEKYIDQINLTHCSPPYLQTTFSLWRKAKYQQLIAQCNRMAVSHQHQKGIIQLFIHTVDDQLLQRFLDRIRKQLSNRLNDERIKMSERVNPKDFNLDSALLYEYNLRMAEFMVILEQIADFIKRPYCPLHQQCLQVKNFIQAGNQQTLGKMFKQKITEKGFALAQKMSRNMLTKIGFFSLISGGNVVMLLGGLAVSKSFQLLAGVYKEFELADKIRKQIPFLEKTTQNLNKNFEDACRLMINCIRQLPQDPDEQIFHNQQYSQKIKAFLSQAIIECKTRSDQEGLLSMREQGPWVSVKQTSITFTPLQQDWELVDIEK